MQLLNLFNNHVGLVLTQVPDGNMKAVRELGETKLQAALSNQLTATRALGLSGGNTALIKVTYDQDDFCNFISLEHAGSYSLNNALAVNSSDGIATTTTNLGIFLPLADCLGLVLYDPLLHALMVVHCGRHTLLRDGAAKAVEFMTKRSSSNPGSLKAWTSPSAGKENYPVHDADNKGLLELAHEQLTKAGLQSCNIELSPIDTTTSPDFYSHSQGDTSRRFALCAKLNERTS